MKRPQARTRLVLDPVLFSDRQHETEEDRMEKLLRIAEEVDRSHGITAPVRAIELHLETVGLRSSCSQGHSYDMFIALTPLYEKILSSAIEEEEGTVELDPERQDVIGQADRELSSMLAHLSKHGCRSVRLLTSHEAWIGEPLGPVAMAKARGFHQMTLQIIRQGLEVSGR